MKTYQYLEKPYVSPINLDVLNTTFSNLETMHQKAVQTGSELKAAIAKLPLNEAEEGFRDNLYTQIQQTIDQNTIHGNLAAGYDDLVKYQGELLTNKALVGRINAQAEYLKTKDYIDKFDIPEEYRKMYRELNQYYYQDEYDENGNIIGGTTWQPNALPTKMINLSDLIIKAIDRTAVEKGRGKVTQWLDSNGKVTTDPSKAYTGHVYNEITSQWERLPEDKIRENIIAIINENPQAKASIMQDYKFNLWSDKKQQAENETLTMTSIRNEDGSIMTPDQYLYSLINPAAQKASYNYSFTENNYGTGYSEFLSKREKTAKAIQKAQQEAIKSNFLNEVGLGGRGVTIKVVTPGEKIYASKNNAYKNIIDTLRELNISDDEINSLINDYDTLNKFIDNIPRNTNNAQIIKKLNFLLRDYKFYDSMFNNMINSLPDEEKELYNLNYKLSINKNFNINGGELENKILKLISDYRYGTNIYEHDDDKINIIEFNIDSNHNYIGNYEIFKDKFKDNKKFKFDDYNHNVTVDFDKLTTYEKLEFINEKCKIDPDKSTFLNHYAINGSTNAYLEFLGYDITTAKEISRLYKTIKDYQRDETKMDYESLNSIELLEGETFGESYYLKGYKSGIIDGTEYTKYVNQYNEDFKRKLKTTAFSQYIMYGSINGKTLELVDQAAIEKYGNIIRQAVEENRYAITPAYVANLEDPLTNTLGGYYITINPKITTTTQTKDHEKELVQLVEDENAYTFYIPSLNLDAAADQILSSDNIRTNNFLKIIGDTKANYSIYDVYDNESSIGNVKITGLSDSSFNLNIFNENYQIDRETCRVLTQGFELVSNIKDVLNIDNIDIDYYLENNTEIVNDLDYFINTMNNVTHKNVDTLESLIYNELGIKNTDTNIKSNNPYEGVLTD